MTRAHDFTPAAADPRVCAGCGYGPAAPQHTITAAAHLAQARQVAADERRAVAAHLATLPTPLIGPHPAVAVDAAFARVQAALTVTDLTGVAA